MGRARGLQGAPGSCGPCAPRRAPRSLATLRDELEAERSPDDALAAALRGRRVVQGISFYGERDRADITPLRMLQYSLVYESRPGQGTVAWLTLPVARPLS